MFFLCWQLFQNLAMPWCCSQTILHPVVVRCHCHVTAAGICMLGFGSNGQTNWFPEIGKRFILEDFKHDIVLLVAWNLKNNILLMILCCQKIIHLLESVQSTVDCRRCRDVYLHWRPLIRSRDQEYQDPWRLFVSFCVRSKAIQSPL